LEGNDEGVPDGFLTIGREIGADPIKDITEAMGFLKERV